MEKVKECSYMFSIIEVAVENYDQNIGLINSRIC